MSESQASALTDLDTPHFGYWKAIYASFFSPALYVDVGKRWKGLSIKYLLLALFVVFIPVGVLVTCVMIQNLDRELVNPIRNLPEFYLQNGKVSLDKPMPYLVKDGSGAVKAIIDTTGKVTSMPREYPDLTIMITKDRLLYRIPVNPPVFSMQKSLGSDGVVEEYVFPADMNEIFNGAAWLDSSGIGRVKLMLVFIIYPSLVMALFGLYMVVFLVMAMMLQFVSYLFLRFSINYLQAFRILMVASTPQFVLLMLLLLFNRVFMGAGVLLFILIALYCSFGLISLRRESNKLVRT